MDIKFSLNKGICFRKYGNKCYVWDVPNKNEYIFNNIVYRILCIISNKKILYFDEFMGILSEKYDISDCSDDIKKFIQYLIEVNILHSYISNNMSIDDTISQQVYENKYLFSALFELTYKCNEKCVHCYVDSYFSNEKKEISTIDAKKVIDNLYHANVAEITFSGAEIFSRKDSLDIIEYASQKGFLIDIFSNATLLDSDSILRLAQCNIKSFHASIYGSNAKLHDSITGISGSFDKTVEVLKILNNLGITTCIKTTVMKENSQDYSNLIKLGESLGCDIQVGMSIIPTMKKNTQHLKHRANKSELLLINMEECKRYNRETKEVSNDLDTSICNAGHSHISINPYGEVVLCVGFDVPIGNAVTDDILDLWNNSDFLVDWRRKTKRDINCQENCELAPYCSFCPAQAYLETDSYIEKYNEACTLAEIEKETREVLRNESAY